MLQTTQYAFHNDAVFLVQTERAGFKASLTLRFAGISGAPARAVPYMFA
jgi:hypothetical protein